jgi:hypothetical protein
VPFDISPVVDRIRVQAGFVLVLRDAVTGQDTLRGDVHARSGVVAAERQGHSGRFVFPALPDGEQIITVASGRWTPFYRSTEIRVTLPMTSPTWPSFPDLARADPGLMLDDPAQPDEYRRQRAAVALAPTTAYPFTGGATLLRGTVRAAGQPVADATVSRIGGDEVPYLTGPDGEFVLFLPAARLTQTIGVRVARDGQADHDEDGIEMIGGQTTTVLIEV